MTASAEPVRLVLDAARCDGHGICALRCPELVSLDRFGFAGVDGEPITDPVVLRRARRAVAGCPERALTILGGERPNEGGLRWPGAAGARRQRTVDHPWPPDDRPASPAGYEAPLRGDRRAES